MSEPTDDSSRLPTETLIGVLEAIRDHGDDPEALPRLNALRDELLRPEALDAVLAAAGAVVNPVLADPSPRPAVHAHMTILLSILLDLKKRRDDVDTLLAAWIRHPASFGADRATPLEFQRPEFVQRLADLIGWGQLDVVKDHEPLGRFLAWVNAWAPKQRQAVRSSIDALRRNFPAPDLWKRVRTY